MIEVKGWVIMIWLVIMIYLIVKLIKVLLDKNYKP